jgi:cytochrome c oxidase subunit 3/cytochrome o ubiquinol oxidase subunit 3
MATNATTAPARAGRIDPERLDPNKVGMIIFLIGEVVFFGSFIFSYVYFRGRQADTGPTAEVLNVPLTALFTVLLLSSSVTIWLAERSQRAGNRGGVVLWLAVTIALGVAFLIGQAFEWGELFDEGITIRTGLFGTTFFTLTGFHGFHVFGGLVLLTILLWASVAGWLRHRHSSALESVSLYWHFVDVVWIAVFSVVYLWELIA